MTKTNNAIGISAVAFFACALVGVACDSGSTSADGSAGAPSFAGSGNAGVPGVAGGVGKAGGPGSAGNGSTTAGAGGGGGSAGSNNCLKLPSNPLLTDFSPTTFKVVTEDSSWTVGKADLWGTAPATLSGGDVFYQGKPGSAPKVTLHGQTLTVSATIAAGDYAGYMFNFKPACTNASTTQGLQFDVLDGSTLGNATLKVQMQQKSDYPSTANPGSRPGDCVPTSVETQYNECLSPATTLASSGATLTTGVTKLPWTGFSGGLPVPTVDSSQLMAIQWQFECPPDGGTASAAGGGGGDAGGGGLSGGAGVGAGGSSGGAGSAGLGGGGTNSGGGDSGLGGGSGFGGASGGPATAGSSGDSGSGGGSGSSGTSGTAGTDGGSSGTAGSGGTAGTPSSTTPPCVVSITIDNVTFY